MANKEKEPDTTEAEIEPAKRAGIMTLVKAVAILSIVVLLEVVGASMMIPSAAETTDLAAKLATADSEHEGDKESMEASLEGVLPAEDMVEVSLGDFHIPNYDPDSGSSLTVDFKLYGTVLADEKGEFDHLFMLNKHRIREQVFIVVRGMDVTDFTDAGWDLIKRKILEKMNRSLGMPLLRGVIFSTFSFSER